MAATLLALTPLCSLAENEISDNNPYNNPDYETAGYTLRAKGNSKLMQQMQPTIKFGGYIMANTASATAAARTPMAVSTCALYVCMPTATFTKTFTTNCKWRSMAHRVRTKGRAYWTPLLNGKSSSSSASSWASSSGHSALKTP